MAIFELLVLVEWVKIAIQSEGFAIPTFSKASRLVFSGTQL